MTASLVDWFQHNPDIVLVSRADGHIEAANPAACAAFGLSEQEIRARGRSGLVDPDVSEATLGAGRHELSVDAVMSSVFLTDDTGGGME